MLFAVMTWFSSKRPSHSPTEQPLRCPKLIEQCPSVNLRNKRFRIPDLFLKCLTQDSYDIRRDQWADP
jgi:hypothetical protein